MRTRIIFASLLLTVASVSTTFAQTGDVVISMNESFFESLLDAVFKDGNTLNFAGHGPRSEVSRDGDAVGGPSSEVTCDDSVKLHREVKGRRTSVTLRDGRILAPIAFTGAYAPPLFGCLEYSGVAETEISLEFDASLQSLVGRAKVKNVSVNGTAGVGGTLIAKFVQRSIDEKINPMQILGLDRVSFAVPVQGAGNISMRAVAINHQIEGGAIVVRITYQFARS